MRIYTAGECYALGASHRAYQWARSPWGHWTPEQVYYYNQGFDGYPFELKYFMRLPE